MNVIKRDNIVYYRMNEIVDMFIQKNKITKEKFVENYSIPASKYIILCSKEGAYVDVETEKNLKSRFCLFVKKNFFDELVKNKNLQPAKNNSKYKILGCPEESLVYRNGEDLEKISKKNKQELIIIPALIKDKFEEEDESDNIEEGDEPDNMEEEDEQIKLLNSSPRELPDRVLLSDEECFRNTDGEIIRLDVVGELAYNKIYFRLGSVADGFELSNLRNLIYDSRSSYELGLDYVYFYINSYNVKTDVKTDVNRRKVIYLTYTGLLKAFYTTRNTNTEPFIKWSVKTLFTVHIGNDKDRARLASELLKIGPKSLQRFLTLSITPISCLYIFYIGTAQELRNKKITINKKIPDTNRIYKYGRTCNVKRREGEHFTKFKKYNIVPELVLFAKIDNNKVTAAETEFGRELSKKDIRISCELGIEYFYSEQSSLQNVKNILKDTIPKYYSDDNSVSNSNNTMLTQEKDNLISILEIKYAACIKENESLIKSHEKQIETKDQVIKSQQETMQELRKRIRQLESNN